LTAANLVFAKIDVKVEFSAIATGGTEGTILFGCCDGDSNQVKGPQAATSNVVNRTLEPAEYATGGRG
jgi:hypothetical protein